MNKHKLSYLKHFLNCRPIRRYFNLRNDTIKKKVPIQFEMLQEEIKHWLWFQFSVNTREENFAEGKLRHYKFVDFAHWILCALDTKHIICI